MILESAEYLGIVAFSASGFYIGKRNSLDILGITIVSFLTALGGGVMRDIIIDRPPIAFTQTLPVLIVALIVTLLLFLRHRYHHDIDSKPLFVLIDAVGMASFSISGALIALENGYNLQGVAIIAFVTAIGGGIFRDILINQVPYVLKGGFYGVIAIGIGMVLFLLDAAGMLHTVTIILLFAAAILLRMYAYLRDWHLPTI